MAVKSILKKDEEDWTDEDVELLQRAGDLTELGGGGATGRPESPVSASGETMPAPPDELEAKQDDAEAAAQPAPAQAGEEDGAESTARSSSPGIPTAPPMPRRPDKAGIMTKFLQSLDPNVAPRFRVRRAEELWADDKERRQLEEEMRRLTEKRERAAAEERRRQQQAKSWLTRCRDGVRRSLRRRK